MPKSKPCPLHRRSLRSVLIAVTTFTLVAFQTNAQEQTDSTDAAHVEQLRQDLQAMITSARDRVFPSLVNIRVITTRYVRGKERRGQSVGSGTVISPEGHVLTNFHVVRNGQKFVCTLADKSEVSARLVGKDPLTDLAVLQLDLDELGDAAKNLQYATLGDSDSLVIGDTVMSMGSPFALSRSVTLGIVSNTDRILTGSGNDVGEMRFDRDQRTGIFTHWIQHDSAISPGNSGGPLVSLFGEVVGINAMGNNRGGGMGFAIPSSLARKVATALIEHGQVPRSWFGWRLKPIKKSGHTEGVLVNSVVENGPAAKSGVEVGDIILAVDDNPVTVWFPEELPPFLERLASYPIGSKIDFTYKRDGENHQSVLNTGALEPDRGDEASFLKWGVVGINLTRSMARNRRLTSAQGVLIQSVRPGSAAQTSEPPIAPGDLVIAVDGEPINSLNNLIEVYDRTGDGELLFEFSRRGRNQVTLLKIKEDHEQKFPRELAKAWVGVAVQPVLANLAEQLGMPDSQGFRITRVYPGTVAAETDLQVGDIITALNGERVQPGGMQDFGMFHRRVRRLEIDGTAELTISRNGETRDISLELERTRLTPAEVNRIVNENFGITVREITFFDRDENRWDETLGGVLIEKLESAGWAQLAGLRPGDLVLRVDNKDVGALKDFREAINSATQANQERVTFLVLRGAETRFQHAEPDWSPQANQASSNK